VIRITFIGILYKAEKMTEIKTSAYLKEILRDAHARTMELVTGLDDEQVMGPRLPIVNPLRWEIGHVAWFYEKFILRDLYGGEPHYPPGDEMYDSIAIDQELRWDLPLLSMADTLDYIDTVRENCISRLPGGMASEQDSYIYQFAAFHEDMHTEAYTYTRQTLSYPAPRFAKTYRPPAAGAFPGDAAVPGGTLYLGSEPDAAIVFDNEKWAHQVALAPFKIAKATVSNAEYAAFVDADGYAQPAFWSDDGWAWRRGENAEHPVYWQRRGAGDWGFRRFDKTIDLPPNEAIIHVNWHEANAYCAWANRRLPTEAEWDAAALAEPNPDGGLARGKRAYPWGAAAPTPAHASLDGRCLGPVDVAAFAAGDSAFGCRQMLGNTWEWTSTTFGPFAGFVPDAYREYSEPVFYETRVLRGGAWATRSRMVTGRYRNFFTPDRRDVMAGFRTCAL